MPLEQKPLALGFIPANRASFSDELALKMRNQAVAAMEKAGICAVVPSPQQTKAGCVENLAEAEILAELFRTARCKGSSLGRSILATSRRRPGWCARRN